MASLVRITAPSDSLFTPQELRSLLRIPTEDNDDLLDAYQAGAVEWVEGLCGCSVMKQQWQLGLVEFPSWKGNERDSGYLPRPILLPRGPMIALDSIEYTDDSGNAITYGDGQLDEFSKPPAIYPPFSSYFPVARYAPNSVLVKYTSGMGFDKSKDETAPDRVLESIKMAVRLVIAHWYENAEPVPVKAGVAKIPYSLEAMIWASRLWRFDWQEYYSC